MERIEGYLTDKFHVGLLRVMEGRWGEELLKDWHNPLGWHAAACAVNAIMMTVHYDCRPQAR